MGRQLFHSTETVWKMLARKEWLGCRHDASPMVDISGSTPVWAQYMYFKYCFYKIYTYYDFKNLYLYYEKTLVVPDVVLARRRSGNVFDRPWCFSYWKWKIHIFIVTDFLILSKLILLNCYIYPPLSIWLLTLLLFLFQASYHPSVYSLRWSRPSFSRYLVR